MNKRIYAPPRRLPTRRATPRPGITPLRPPRRPLRRAAETILGAAAALLVAVSFFLMVVEAVPPVTP